jgi:hypothetical protein
MKSFTRNLIRYVCSGIGLFVGVQGAVAQSGEELKFTCVVAKTYDDTNFLPMGRLVVCPVTFSATLLSQSQESKRENDASSPNSWRARVGTDEDFVRYLSELSEEQRVSALAALPAKRFSSACVIKPNETKCSGSIKIEYQYLWQRSELVAFGTAPSLLIDQEVLAGAVPVAPGYPNVKATFDSDKRELSVSHKYAFPTPTNPYHNAALPGDVNGDGKVAPNDVALLGEFLWRNNWRVNLTALGKLEGTMPPFPDVNKDLLVSTADYQGVVQALNRR